MNNDFGCAHIQESLETEITALLNEAQARCGRLPRGGRVNLDDLDWLLSPDGFVLLPAQWIGVSYVLNGVCTCGNRKVCYGACTLCSEALANWQKRQVTR